MNVKDLKWWQKTILYEIYPKSFQDTTGSGMGDLAGITKRLPYLASLGVGAIWLTPVYASPMVDGGYDIADYYDVDPLFGTMEDMDTLIAKADELGIKVVMDLVFNHTSNQNQWFLESAKSREGTYADWYIWKDARPDGSAPTNWRGIFGGPAWTWCEARQQYYMHTFASAQPDLNWENPVVRQELANIANFWADKGVGGFRIDAISYIKKPAFVDGTPDSADGTVNVHDVTANTEGILDFLHEFRDRTSVGRDIFTVGEANGVPASDLGLWVGEKGVFDMLIEFNHMKVPLGGNEVWYRPADWKLTELKAMFAASQANTVDQGWYPMFWENHDQPRSVNHFFPAGTDPKAAAKALGTLVLTMRGTPFLYEGQELGYTNATWGSVDDFDDIQTLGAYKQAIVDGCSEDEAMDACREYSRDNARTPMQWDASDQAGFTTGSPWLPVHADYATQNVEAESADPDSVLTWYRRVSDLRRSHAEFISGDWCEQMAESERVFAYTRSDGDHVATVLVNMTSEPATYDAALVDGAALLAGTHEEATPGTLRPLEAVIFEA